MDNSETEDARRTGRNTVQALKTSKTRTLSRSPASVSIESGYTRVVVVSRQRQIHGRDLHVCACRRGCSCRGYIGCKQWS